MLGKLARRFRFLRHYVYRMLGSFLRVLQASLKENGPVGCLNIPAADGYQKPCGDIDDRMRIGKVKENNVEGKRKREAHDDGHYTQNTVCVEITETGTAFFFIASKSGR
jgi:hypothetical protein